MNAVINMPNTSQYSDEQRREAVGLYLVHGVMTKVSELMSIPRVTLHDWSKTEWWQTLTESIRQEKNDELDNQLSNIIHTGVQVMQDRLVNGEEVILKDGSRARKAVSGRDAAIITGTMFDKRQLLRNQPTKINTTSTDDRLTALADKIRKLEGGSVTIEGERLNEPDDKGE